MLHLPTPKLNNHHDKTQTNQYHNLYSNTRNSFSRSIAIASSTIMKHQTHTKTGDVTRYGFIKGYIQASKHAGVDIFIEYYSDSDMYYVKGMSRDGRSVAKPFTKLTYARAYLKSFT